MESRTVEPDALDLSEEVGVSDALREAVEEEMEFLERRGLKLVRMRADDEGDVFQITIQAGDEMYRISEVAPGNVSRTVFRNPEKDGAVPYQDEAGDGEEEVEEETVGEREEPDAGDEDTSEEEENDEDASKEGEDEERKEEGEKEESEETGDEDEDNSEDVGESEEDDDEASKKDEVEET